MYSVSNDYKLKMLSQVQTHKLTGTIDSIPFTGEDVIGVSYTNMSTDKNVKIGGVFIGTLKLTFLTDILNRGSYQDKKITLSDSLLLGYDENEAPIWETIPIGEFYVSDATWRAEGMIDITAYDCLSLMDEPLEIDLTSGSVYSFCKYIETMTGAPFGMTAEECQALPNGTEILHLFEKNSLETYRDLLSAVATMVAGFAYADRSGTWKLKKYNDESVLTIPKDRRISGSKFSDFTTYYDTVTYTDVRSGIERRAGDGEGMTMDLGDNPFLQYGSIQARYIRAAFIADAIEDMTYTPYSVSMLPALIILDLGDVIKFSNDYADEATTGAVMSITWTYNKSVNVQCFGDNPKLQSGKSKADKSISGLRRSSASNQIEYYHYVNIDPITLGSDEEIRIAKLIFTPMNEATVKITHELLFDMVADLSTDSSYEIHYYLDNEQVLYKPYESLTALKAQTEISGTTYEGDIDEVSLSICRDFFYFIRDVEPNRTHTWEVRVITHGIESTTFDVNHIRILLEGQNLYGEGDVGGYIEAEDDVTLFDIGFMEMVEIEEGTGSSEPKVIIGLVTGYILTEAGDVLNAENGDRLITNADTKISDLPSASAVNSDAEFPITQSVNGTDTTLKANIEDIGDYIAGTQTFAGLNTTAKTLIGAINEILANQ